MQLFACSALLILGLTQAPQADSQTTEVYSWVTLDYDWKSDSMRENYISQGKFVVNNSIITGIKIYQDEVYVTVPRWRHGVPSTLNRVILKGGNPVLQPYPSWEMQEVDNCSALQYVQSMEIDPNTGLMWIIDNGRINIFQTPRNLCPPKLLVYNMTSNEEVHRFVFPSEVANPNTCFLNDIVLDYVDGCVKYAYITDTRDAKLYVYDVSKNEAYYFTDPTMLSEPPNTGTPIDGIAISADFRFVYYCPIDGLGLFQIPTSVLQDKASNFGDHVRRVGDRFSRADGLAYGQQNLYYGLLDISGVQRWLVAQDAEDRGYEQVTIISQEPVARDDIKMQWADTFAWDDSGYLWFTANDLKRYFNGSMDYTGASGPNMYVWKVFVNESSYLANAVGSSAPRECPVDRLSSGQDVSTSPTSGQDVSISVCFFTLVASVVVSFFFG